MVLAAKVDRVDVHAAIIGPVVSERNEELNPSLVRGLYNLVEARKVNGARAVGVPHLEDDLGRAGALVAIVGQATRNVGAILVVEPPGAED